MCQTKMGASSFCEWGRDGIMVLINAHKGEHGWVGVYIGSRGENTTETLFTVRGWLRARMSQTIISEFLF